MLLSHYTCRTVSFLHSGFILKVYLSLHCIKNAHNIRDSAYGGLFPRLYTGALALDPHLSLNLLDSGPIDAKTWKHPNFNFS